MEGTINSIEAHGSIVIVWLDLEDGERIPIYFEARPFSWMLEGEGSESPDDLVGRPVCFNGHSIEFLDNVEAA